MLDLTRVLAGPWCTQLLGDMGAEVIKVERPDIGDDSRTYGSRLSVDGEETDESAFFLACNRNKRSVAIDFSRSEGSQLLARLAARSDVFVENYKAGSLAAYGLDYATLKRTNPRLIYCSITGFGNDAGARSEPAYDFIIQGMSGVMSTCGLPDMPLRTAIPFVDLSAGYNALAAILGAVIERGRTGKGGFIDVALLDSAVALNVHFGQEYLLSGRNASRHGNSNPIAVPSDAYRTADGWLLIAAGNQKQFEALCRALDGAAMLDDARFDSMQRRLAHRDEVKEAVEKLLQCQSSAHWIAILRAEGVPCGPVNSLEEAFASDAVKGRRMVTQSRHGRGVDVPLIRSPLGSAQDSRVHVPPPMLGQHTAEVLCDELQISDDELSSLQANRVVGIRPASTHPKKGS